MIFIILFFILGLFGLILQLYDHFGIKNFKYRNAVKISLYIIAGTSLTMGLIDKIHSKHQTEQIERISVNQIEMCKELEELRIRINKNENLFDSIAYEGISYNFLIKLFEDNKNSRKFIWDNGESILKDRISIYLDINNNLHFQIIDDLNETYQVSIKSSLRTFTFNELIYLCCEYGIIRDSSFIRIKINGVTVAKQFFDHKIQIPDIKTTKGTLGANLDYQEAGSFDVHEIIVFNMTLSSIKLYEILKYLNVKMKNKGAIRFRNGAFMIRDLKKGGFFQNIHKYQPIDFKIKDCN